MQEVNFYFLINVTHIKLKILSKSKVESITIVKTIFALLISLTHFVIY